MRRLFLLLPLLIGALFAVPTLSAKEAATAADPLDAIIGLWRGHAGTPDNNADWALVIKRNEQGVVTGYVHYQLLNFYGLDAGPVTHADGVFTLPPFRWSVRLVDGRLVGADIGPFKISVDLARTDTLPTEVPLPDLPAGPAPRWSVKLGGQIYAPAAVRDGIAYVGTTGGTFNALRVSDGSFVWTIPAGRPVHGEALLTDEHVFFVCDNGYLFKLARADGKEVWKYDLGDAQAPRVLMHQKIFFWDYKAPKPALADGTLYVGSGNGSFHAVDAATGARVWQVAAAKDRIRTDALVVGDRVYFGSFDNHMYGLNRADGTEVWKRVAGPVNAAPTLVGGHIAFGSRGTVIATLNPDTGVPVWRSFMWGSSAESSLVPFGDRAYAGSSDLRRITAFEAATGRVLWRTDIFGIAWGAPAVTEKILYASAGGYEPYQVRHFGGLLALDRETGRILWRWAAPRAAHQYETGFAAGPVLAGDTLVIGSMDGTLYGFPVAP